LGLGPSPKKQKTTDVCPSIVAPPKGAVSCTTLKDTTFVFIPKAIAEENGKQVIGLVVSKIIIVEDLPKKAVRDEVKIIENEKRRTEKKKREKKIDKSTHKSLENPQKVATRVLAPQVGGIVVTLTTS
jgi:hypothetical protein